MVIRPESSMPRPRKSFLGGVPLGPAPNWAMQAGLMTLFVGHFIGGVPPMVLQLS